jgi:hypothetical protein
MQPAQPPGPDPPVHRIAADTPLEQLRPCHDAVLRVRQSGDHEVRGGFAAHIAV